MNWTELTDIAQLDEINQLSSTDSVLIFKHSTRCPISSMALNRLESNWDLSIPVYLLDLISYREISNEVAKTYQVEHQSPQVLLIKNGEMVYDASHNAISVNSIKEFL